MLYYECNFYVETIFVTLRVDAQLDGFIYHFRDPLRNPEDRTNPAENVCNIG